MTFELIKIADAGNFEQERAVLRAKADFEVGHLVVLCTKSKTKEDGNRIVIAVIHHAFWFPDRSVKEGDLIVLYTKSGKHSSKESSDGKTSYFFYWDLKEPIWSFDDRALVVGRYSSWKSLFTEVPKLDDIEPGSAQK